MMKKIIYITTILTILSCSKIEPELKVSSDKSQTVESLASDGMDIEITNNGSLWISSRSYYDGDNHYGIYEYENNIIKAYQSDKREHFWFAKNKNDIFFIEDGFEIIQDGFEEMPTGDEYSRPFLTIISKGETKRYTIPTTDTDKQCFSIDGAYVLKEFEYDYETDRTTTRLLIFKNNEWSTKELPSTLSAHNERTIFAKNNHIIDLSYNDSYNRIWIYNPISNKEQTFLIDKNNTDLDFLNSAELEFEIEVAPNGNIYRYITNKYWSHKNEEDTPGLNGLYEFNFESGETIHNNLEDLLAAYKYDIPDAIAFNNDGEVWLFGQLYIDFKLNYAYHVKTKEATVLDFNSPFVDPIKHATIDNNGDFLLISGNGVYQFEKENLVNTYSINGGYFNASYVDDNNDCWFYETGMHGSTHPEIYHLSNGTLTPITDRLMGWL